MEHEIADPVGPGPARRVLITGAGGQLGHALAEVFPEADARTRNELDVTRPLEVAPPPDVVLHAAAWTGVGRQTAWGKGVLRVTKESEIAPRIKAVGVH